MRLDTTDQEQIEAIKKFWNDYGKSIIIAVIFGLIIGFGWRYWNNNKIHQAQKASLYYQQLISYSDKNQFKEADALGQKIISTYPKTIYASMAALSNAKNAVAQKDLKSALDQLQWVIAHCKKSSIKQIARLRAARILNEMKKPNIALGLLDTVDNTAFQGQIDQVKGDIYLALGKKAEAREHYKSAQQNFSQSGATDPLLDMKLSK